MDKNSDKNAKNEDFLKYAIAQRAILNVVPYNGVPSKELGSNTEMRFSMMALKTRYYRLMMQVKYFIRDRVLKGFIKEKIVLIGTGGHAKVVVDLIRTEGRYEIVGCTSSDVDAKDFENLRIFGTDDILPVVLSKGVTKAFVAIGNNDLRHKISSSIEKMGFELVTLIHPKAHLASNVLIGAGSCVMAGATINPHAIVGRGVIINTNANIDHDNFIGDWAHIAPGCSLAGNVTIGNGTLIGVGSSVIPSVTIGEWCTVGAGSVVVKNIPDKVKAFGVPARIRE